MKLTLLNQIFLIFEVLMFIKDERKLKEELERLEEEKQAKIKQKEDELRKKLEKEEQDKAFAIKAEAKKMLDIEMQRKKELFEKKKKR